MAAQTNYSNITPKGVPGGIYDISDNYIFTRQNEEEDGVLGFGVAVVPGKIKGTGIKLPSAESAREDLEGIVVHLPNTEQDMEGKVIIRKGRPLSIMRKGSVWVKVTPETKAEYGKKAYVVVDSKSVKDNAEGKIDYRGYITSAESAENSGTNPVYSGCRFTGVCDMENGIAVIDIQ